MASACNRFQPVSWRTPNGWVFVAACQTCGAVASSISDGGAALYKLNTLHESAAEAAIARATQGAE